MRNARPVIRAFTRRTVAIRALFLLFFVSIALFAPKVQAKAFSVWGRDFDLRVTTTLRYDYRADNQNGPNVLVFPGSPPRPYNDFDDEYHYIFHTMDLQLSTGRLRIGTRLDLNLFLDTPLAGCAQAGSNRPAACGHRYLNQLYLARQDRKIPGGDEPYHFAGPERMFLTYADDAWDVTLGDFTASFGAGIALLATKISDVGQDHAVRGGKLRIHKGPVEATLLAGTFNFLDTDVFTGVASRTIWAEEPLFGASFRYTLGDRFLRLGSHVVHVLRDAPLNGGDPYDTVWGLTAALPNLLDGDLSISTEVDFQRTFNGSCVSRGPDRDCDGIAHGDTHPFHGVASYAHASLSRGNWTFTGEAKYFNDFKLNGSQSPIEAYQLTYSQAPTLERAYAIPTETANTGGARIRTDYNFEEIFKGLFELLVFANVTWMRSWGDEGLLELIDPYAGFELQWMEGKGHWNLMGGLRYERIFGGDGIDLQTFRTDIHIYGDLEQLVVANHSVSLSYFYRRSKKLIFSGLQTYTQMDLSLGYKWSPHLALAFYLGYSSEPAAVGDDPRFLLGGEIRYFIRPGTSIRVYVGERRGGLICVNGVCRVLPQFSGAVFEAVARF